MKQHGYVYRVTNLINGMVYVGQRRGEFKSWYRGTGVRIRNAVAKHGAENFALEFVQSAFFQADLDKLEAHFIAVARRDGPTYNIRDGGLGSLFNGKGPHHGRRHSAKAREQMSISRSGVKNPMFGKDFTGARNPMFGKKQTEETKRKIGESNRKHRGDDHGNYGKKRAPEVIEAMRVRAFAQAAAVREAKK